VEWVYLYYKTISGEFELGECIRGGRNELVITTKVFGQMDSDVNLLSIAPGNATDRAEGLRWGLNKTRYTGKGEDYEKVEFTSAN
jgi:hypothetical protein